MNELLTKCLQVGSVGPLLRVPKPLLGTMESGWVDWIGSYMARHGVPPTLERFEKQFAAFMRVETPDPLDDVAERTMARRRNVHFVEVVTRHQKDLREGMDPSRLVHEMDSVFRASDGSVTSTRFPDHSSYFAERTVHPFGVPLLDRSAGGVANGDYVLVVGRPGSFKTTFAEWLLNNFRLRGLKALYVSNENSPDEVRVRLDAFLVGFNPIMYRTGRWTDAAKARLRTGAYLASVMDGEIVLPEEPLLSVDQVAAAIDEHGPDVVFVDGIYLMSASGRRDAVGWEDTAAVSRALKRLARSKQVPIMGTIQANRGAEQKMVDRENVALTDAFLQDADTMISMNRIGDRVLGSVVKSRWGATLSGESFLVDVNHDHMTLTFPDAGGVTVDEESW